MQIKVNDNEQEIAQGTTVEQLLKILSVSGPVAVELNRKICTRKNHSQTILENGDVLEIVTIVGGG